ncbi:MAG: valine--tRNA ligase, partial [Armatimonadetes bacterium]|nr:valine--tRNA ligase [Armatimonadota bacterium]
QRMLGKNVLCLPGTDHAGIATQVVVEKEIAKEGKTRHELGREKFLERVWQWKEQYGGMILSQLRTLGCSYDWRRERFTMDDGYVKAVLMTFIQLANEGLIYRGHRVINWCSRCLTALSDLEVEHESRPSKLWFIRYPATDGGYGIVVATTRPETMLGDTAVAVHPNDERYKHLIGSTVILPLMHRIIPVISDESVDPTFGTGAVKVTPAHDAADFEIGERHGLERVIVIDEFGRMTEHAGKFAGMDRYECREAVVSELERAGLLIRTEEYEVPLALCYRCGTAIEPLLSVQWFVRMKPLAEPAIEVIRSGRVKYVPERFGRMTIEWLENIKDWCISRQIWWGHRIPVWYCRDCNGEKVSEWQLPTGEVRIRADVDAEWFAAIEQPKACPKCGSENIVQDSDVLDTWFSSAIWPHATLGWPDKTKELEVFYPTDLMITARDILYLWVARMIMTGLKFAGDIPFRTVYVHPTILTKEGKRMSKSLGTGVDPLELIDRYGADALRFGLTIQCELGQDIRFSEERLDMARDFANKIWNATRYVLMNLDEEVFNRLPTISELKRSTLTLPDRWILSRLQHYIARINGYLEGCEFDRAAKAIYDFVWDEFCDWYIEISKCAISQRDSTRRKITQAVLCRTLDSALRLLHPFMPFLTEGLWQRLPHGGDSIMVSPFPRVDEDLIDLEAESSMDRLMWLVSAIRNIKSEMGFSRSACDAIMFVSDESMLQLIKDNLWWITSLARLREVEFHSAKEPRPKLAASASSDCVEIYIPLRGVVDAGKEMERLNKQLAKVMSELERVSKRLQNERFLQNAPSDVIEAERKREADLRAQLEQLQRRFDVLKELQSSE